MAVAKKLQLKNFTVFADSEFVLARNLNILVGENGTGKTHLLKVLYSTISALYEDGRRSKGSSPLKTAIQASIAEKLVNVFKPDSLGRLATRTQGKSRCEVRVQFGSKNQNVSFSFSTNSKTEVQIKQMPSEWPDTEPTYLPTRELLSVYPNFTSLYDKYFLEFEETWRDTCSILGRPLQRGVKEQSVSELLHPLEEAMEGKIELDKSSGRFYLRTKSGRMEIPLVAEGLRKLGMLARLIATGALLDRGYLFWDEPEANLNPRIIRQVAEVIVRLADHGIQIFVATHNVFLLRELELCLRDDRWNVNARFFGLHRSDNGVEVKSGEDIAEIGSIVSLEEELQQSDRFLGV